MTPVPLELPARPSDSVALARLALEAAGAKALTDDIRNRLAARSGSLRLEEMRPWFGSLARDPVHRAACYLAVDGVDGAPLLLHFAPPSAPTSSVFPKALLIGRAADVVVNAVPFDSNDREALDAFSTRVDTAFQPRPQGGRSAIVMPPGPATFDAFRTVQKRTGKNLAATEGSYYTALWSAIRAGWRDGWSAGVELDGEDPLAVVRECPRYTRFTWKSTDFAAAAQIRPNIAEIRSAAKAGRTFDFELSFAGAARATTAGEVAAALASVRAELVEPKLDASSDVEALAAAALRARSMISVRAPWPAVAGRSTYKVGANVQDLDAIAALLA